MLLRKIKTRGFLGHLGAVGASENGKPAFVELDFTDTDLSLVHGANGAGKSTVWDALLFCFFKEHRGGGSNFARLIHDRADRAEMSVEFEIDNQIWEIYGEICKTKRGAANVVRRLCLITGENKTTKCESDGAVDLWVQKKSGNVGANFHVCRSAQARRSRQIFANQAETAQRNFAGTASIRFLSKVGRRSDAAEKRT